MQLVAVTGKHDEAVKRAELFAEQLGNERGELSACKTAMEALKIELDNERDSLSSSKAGMELLKNQLAMLQKKPTRVTNPLAIPESMTRPIA